MERDANMPLTNVLASIIAIGLYLTIGVLGANLWQRGSLLP